MEFSLTRNFYYTPDYKKMQVFFEKNSIEYSLPPFDLFYGFKKPNGVIRFAAALIKKVRRTALSRDAAGFTYCRILSILNL